MNELDIKWLPHKTINHDYVKELLKDSETTGQYTNGGPNVARLEQTIRDKLLVDDQKAIICINNGSAALHAIAAAIELELEPGHPLKWATQAFTFPTSVQGPLAGSAIVDIDRDGGLDLTQVPEDIDGIIVTNIFGNVVDISKYEEWAKAHNKILLFDNAATPYTFYKGKNSINYGHGSIISFHHTKPIGFGEGGAIIVDRKYENAVRRIINFGLGGPVSGKWNSLGSNYKMSDIAAVYIIQFLSNFDHIVKQTQAVYLFYKNLLRDTDITTYPDFSDPDRVPLVSCFCAFHPSYNDDKVNFIIANRVFCRKYYYPLASRPVCDDFYNKIICLPCHYQITLENVADIIKLLLTPATEN